MSGKGRKGAWGDQGFNSRGQDKGHKGQKGQKGKPTSSPTFFEEHAKGQKGKPGHQVGQDGPEHILMPTPCTDSVQTQQLLWSGGEEAGEAAKSFYRGHLLGGVGELYFEVSGQCRIQLVVPASTKMSSADQQNFDVPTRVANRDFQSVNHLLREIVSIRDLYSNSDTGRLSAAHEELMRAVFANHPEAERKLQGMQFIRVGPNPRSSRPNDSCFYIMTNETDGDDISYMKCLRRLSEVALQETPGEHVVPLAAMTSKYEGLSVRIGADDILVEPGTLEAFGVHVELYRKLLSVHTQKRIYGPWMLHHGSDARLMIVADMAQDEVAITWKAPFQVHCGSEPALPRPHMGTAQPPSLQVCLDALADKAGIAGAFAASSEEEMQLVAGQVLFKALSSSTQLARSKAGALSQIHSLKALAKHQSYELLLEQLRNSQVKLREATSDRDMARLALDKLHDELATLRRSIFPPQVVGTVGTEQDFQDPGRSTSAESVQARDSHLATDESIEALSQRLKEHLPEPAATMLRNSLSLMSSELYSGPSRALWELVQNADDCRYKSTPHMKIVADSAYLWLEYNEAGFTFQDVEALCSLGMSMKGPGQTGHKGVGFKASFVLSCKPHVLSNPYRFYFNEEADCILPHVTPHVLNRTSFPQNLPSSGTAIYLPLRKPVPSLLQEVVPSTLLFLRQLRSLSLESVDAGQVRTYVREGGDEGPVAVVEQAETTRKHDYYIARGPGGSIAVAFPLSCSSSEASWISTTLPLCTLPGLKTPLDAPFELTANREALLEGSARNAALRDALAHLWLQAVESTQDGSALAARAWTLQPGPELAQLPFWSPFLHRVRSGLQEISLVPVLGGTGQARRLPVTRCRKAESRLLGELALGPKELEMLDLGIPSPEYLSQLPEGTDLGLREFGVADLLRLLCLPGDPPNAGAERSRWEARGNQWRKKVTQELAWQKHDIDAMTLRKVPLFPLAEGDDPDVTTGACAASPWRACDEGHIFWSLPRNAPKDLLRVLHVEQGCREDRDLLNLLGCGWTAQPRDVAYAIVQQNLGLSTMEDQRFSWTKLAYLGRHWDEILSSSATENWLAMQTAGEMEKLLRSVLVPSRGGGGRLRCDARELHSPFFLGCKPLRGNSEGSDVILEPPGAAGVKARLWWELVFLRLGARPCVGSVRLPKGLFALPGIAGDLRALLSFYGKSVDLRELRSRCEIEDRSGRVRTVGREPEKRKHSERLLGPRFLQFTGPEYVVDIAEEVELEGLAQQLLGVVLAPTCAVLLALLARVAKLESRYLLASYDFLSAEWKRGQLPLECAELEELKHNGFWVLAEDGQIVRQLPTEVCRGDVERTGAGEAQEGRILEFFVACFGVMISPQPESASGSEAPCVPPSSSQDSGKEKDSAKGAKSKSNKMEGREKKSGHAQDGENPDTSKREPQPPSTSANKSRQLPKLPLLREGVDAEVEVAGSAPFRPLLAELPLLSKLLADIFKEGDGDERLFGSMVPGLMEVPVSQIRFTQTSIAGKFIHGRFKGCRVEAVAKDLKNGKLRPADLPIAVVRFNSSFWTLNNRTLYVLNHVSRQRAPLLAWVAQYTLCPITAKFLQLRYGSLLKEDAKSISRLPALKDEEPEPSHPDDADDQPAWDSGDEELLEKGMA